MNNQTEYLRQLREHLEDGLGWSNLTDGQKKGLACRFYIDKADEAHQQDLAITKAALTGFRLICLWHVSDNDMNAYLHEGGMTIADSLTYSDFAEELERMRLEEDKADRTSQAEFKH